MNKLKTIFVFFLLCLFFTSCDSNTEKSKYRNLSGKWIDVERTHGNNYLILNEDQTCEFFWLDGSTEQKKYEISENYIIFYSEDSDDYFINNDDMSVYDLNVVNDIPHIMNDFGANFVRESDLSFTEIEITTKNWKDYFDIEYRWWTQFDIYDHQKLAPKKMGRYGYIVLKDDIGKRIVGVPDGYDYGANGGSEYGIRIQYSEEVDDREVIYNQHTQDFDVSEVIYHYSRGTTIVRAVNQYDFWELGAKYNETADACFDQNDGIPHKDGRWGVNIPMNMEISYVDGKLLLYDNPVYMYNINTEAELNVNSSENN